MILFHCHKCDTRLSATPELFGTSIGCPACATWLKVPQLEDASKNVQAKSSPLAAPSDDLKARILTLTEEVKRLQANLLEVQGLKEGLELKLNDQSIELESLETSRRDLKSKYEKLKQTSQETIFSLEEKLSQQSKN